MLMELPFSRNTFRRTDLMKPLEACHARVTAPSSLATVVDRKSIRRSLVLLLYASPTDVISFHTALSNPPFGVSASKRDSRC